MKYLLQIAMAFSIGFLGCSQKIDQGNSTQLSETPIIPKPNQVINGKGMHVLKRNLSIEDEFGMDKAQEQLITSLLRSEENGTSVLLLKEASELPEEGYHLDISPELITVSASSASGILNAVYTITQINSLSERNSLPAGQIIDQPLFHYRGMMLDIARHFFSVEEIKTIIDEIAIYKINRLHLHLSDDQGWRIEIKSWPMLTEIGGSVEVGSSLDPNEKQGGFLTQEDYHEIVDYAMSKGIMIIPEIDMPGHTNAALASYPELNCNDEATKLYTGTEVGFSSLCIGKEITYQFIEDVIKEISALTPGKYFHIGGDESHATEHQDYLKFINRVKGIVNSQGKIMMGWDEIAQADVDSLSVVQLWAHVNNAKMGLEKNSKVLLSPAHKTYIDMKYDSLTEIGYSWANYINLDTAYNWEPASFRDDKYQNQIIGIEAPLWTETITNLSEAEFLIFPRIAAYAEIAWSSPDNRDWNDFKNRVKLHESWWKSQDINFYDGRTSP